VSTALAVVVAFALGLVVGSFLNVVLWRVPRGESIVTPGSHCTECGAPLRARELVPVASWVAQRGRCRTCGARISVRYPLVELATGIVFAAVTALALG
jgi:leader peptidase (prepilin peptidase)/N-methyltransferase